MAKPKITEFYKENYDNQVSRAEDYANKQKAQVENIYNNDVAKLESDANKQSLAGENSYYSAYADNAVQRAINERNIRTSMAKQGLTDSGLNRTQLSAVELQKSNADLAVGLQRQSFLNNVRSKLNENKFALTKQKNEQINSIDNILTEQKNQIATSEEQAKQSKMEEIINTIQTMTDPTQVAGYIKSVERQYGIDGATLAAYSHVITKKNYNKYLKNENYYKNRNTYKELHTSLASVDTTAAAGQTIAAKQIKAWTNGNKNATKTQIKKLCASAGISYSDYLKFLKDGQLFKKREDANTIAIAQAKKASSSSGSSGGGKKKSSSGKSGSNVNIDLSDDTIDGLDSVKDYDSAMKFIKDNGGKTTFLMLPNEYARRYKETDKYSSYENYLKDKVINSFKKKSKKKGK